MQSVLMTPIDSTTSFSTDSTWIYCKAKEINFRPEYRSDHSRSRNSKFKSIYSHIYHGHIPDKDLINMFKNEPSGAFLVRDDPRMLNSVVITWKKGNEICNTPILYDVDRRLYLIQTEEFYNLRHFVNRQMKKMTEFSPYSRQGNNYPHKPATQTQHSDSLSRSTSTRLYNQPKTSPNDIKRSYSHNESQMPQYSPTRPPLQASISESPEDPNLLPAADAQNGKSHEFKKLMIMKIKHCGICKTIMWPNFRGNVECTHCGVQAHRNCGSGDSACKPTMEALKKVFGVELELLHQATQRSVPLVLHRLVCELEKRGALNVQGIYRVSASRDDLDRVEMELNKNCDHDLSSYHDVFLFSDLIKKFLYHLPTPVITKGCYELLREEILQNNKTVLTNFREILHKLPKSHYDTLNYLLRHLSEVNEHSKSNFMGATNLSSIFSIILVSHTLPIGTQTDDFTKLKTSLQEQTDIILFLIENASQLFDNCD